MSRLLLCLCLLASVVAFSACGGEEEDVSEILAQTFGGGGEDVESGRLDLNVRLNAEGLPNVTGPVGLRLAGPFASTEEGELPRFDFNVGLMLGGQNIDAGAVSTGDKGFLKFQGQAFAVSDQLYSQFKQGYAEQAKCAEEQGDGGGVTFQSLGIDPRRWLRDPRIAGDEEVGGAQTTHIVAGIDVPRFLEDVNRVLTRAGGPQQQDPCADEQQGNQPESTPGRQLTEQQRRQIAEAVRDARIEVWTGEDDRILRRANVAVRFEVPEGSRQNARGLSRGDVQFDLTIADVNEDVDITAPENAQPLEQLLQRFGGQVPGLGGGAQAPQGGAQDGGGRAAQGGGGAAQGGSEYQQCVAEAAGDIKKLQTCAELIGR